MPPISTNTAVNLNRSESARTSPLSLVRDGTHTVKTGDTMTAIARKAGVSLGELVSANPQVRDPNKIYAGQEIKLPSSRPPAASAPATAAPEATHVGRGRSDAPPSAPVENGGLSASTLRARSESQATQPSLRQGARGDQVKELQQQLAKKGYNPGRADGVFGRQTLAAVRGLQRAQGIAADGVVGPQTRSKLAAAPDNPIRAGGQDAADRQGATGRNKTASFDRVLNNGQRNQRVDGRITINGQTYKFRSGGGGKGNLPAGDYRVTRHLDHRSDKRTMMVGGEGYSFALSNKYDPRVNATRTALRIHPDGGGPGTIGCIGIVGDAATQRRFRQDMLTELRRNGGSFNLRVGQ